MIQYQPVKWRWLRNGALLGAGFLLTDLLEWRGQKFRPWDSTNYVVENIAYLFGGALALGTVFLIVGFFVDLTSKKSEVYVQEQFLDHPLKPNSAFEMTMVQRLGMVLYWLGWIASGLMAALAAVAIFNSRNGSEIVGYMFLAGAVVAWLIGRAIKYVLVGR